MLLNNEADRTLLQQPFKLWLWICLL